MSEFNWNCPYCNSKQTVTGAKIATNQDTLSIGDNADGIHIGYSITAIGCSNTDCKKVTLNFNYGSVNHYSQHFTKFNKYHLSRQLLPENSAKPQPDYIPDPIKVDYIEACQIVNLSPKASATLSRRCLQGIIRDFCKIKKNRLIEEINTLRNEVNDGTAPQGVTLDSVEAIDNVRSIGNIGAHMEKDINVIVDVDPEEAQILIELIETLFDEWYVARHNRQQRFSKIKAIAEQKSAAKKKPATAKSQSKNIHSPKKSP